MMNLLNVGDLGLVQLHKETSVWGLNNENMMEIQDENMIIRCL